MKTLTDVYVKNYYLYIKSFIMNTITNINIMYGEYTLPYIIEYVKGDKDVEFKFTFINDNILFKTDLIRSTNTWDEINDNIFKWDKIIGIQSMIRLYFPQHSVEIYNPRAKYALDIYTYIGSSKIILGSFKIDRLNALASPIIKSYQNIQYYEYIDIPILDPYNLIYSDEYEDFRKSIKNEDINNDCSLLYCSLHVIEENGSGKWIPNSDFGDGANMFQISNEINNYLHYQLNYNDDNISIVGTIGFNEIYNNDLNQYLNETYNINSTDVKIKYMLTVNDSMTWIEEYSTSMSYIFDKYIIKTSPIYSKFESWDDWKDGMSFMSTAVIYTLEEGEWVDKIILKSNQIPITQDIFSKLITDETYKIDVNNYFDNTMNINIINTIQQSSISYNIPDNSKSNIIIPIFYKVRDLGSIVVHPEVVENICINLDAYKTNVNSFILQIEGIRFNEIGTTHAGTIFKVIGPSLPAEKMSGTYYILTQDGEMITSGKYNYEL